MKAGAADATPMAQRMARAEIMVAIDCSCVCKQPPHERVSPP